MPRRSSAFLLLAGGAATFLPFVTAPMALAAGMMLALLAGNPHAQRTAGWAGRLLRVCVIGLGFGMSLSVVAGAAASGLAYTVAGVFAAFSLGLLLGRALGVERDAAFLVSSGTSICGGSAIAAVSSAIRARPETMGAALGIVFILNAVALYLFPAIGRLFGLTQTQFAIWAAVAIHDTSSVVAAAAAYGAQALEQATVLKLARTLWLIPLVIGAAWAARRGRLGSADERTLGRVSIAVPWFPVLFVGAVLVRSFAPAELAPLFDAAARAARRGLPLVLFLVGSSLTLAALRAVGMRVVLQAVTLWVVMAGAVLAAVMMLAP